MNERATVGNWLSIGHFKMPFFVFELLQEYFYVMSCLICLMIQIEWNLL